MNSKISITNGTYGVLSEKDVKNQIVALGKSVNVGDVGKVEEIVPILEQLLSHLKEKKRN
jgi:hypothetical protein